MELLAAFEYQRVRVKCKPGEPESLNTGNLDTLFIRQAYRLIFAIPGNSNIDSINTISELSLVVLFQFAKGISLENAIEFDANNQFLGVIGIRSAVINAEIKLPGFFVALVGISKVVTRVPGPG